MLVGTTLRDSGRRVQSMIQQRTIIALFTLLVTLSSAIYFVAEAETGESTPDPLAVESIFGGDTCAPPCFLDMTPGISTAADIEIILDEHPNIARWGISEIGTVIDEHTGLLIEGEYGMLGEDFTDGGSPVYAQLLIENGVLTLIVVRQFYNNDFIVLSDTLAALGEPTQVRLTPGPENTPFLDLLYLDQLMVVTLEADPDTCNVNALGTAFRVTEARYYSPQEAANPVPSGLSGEEQPKLIAYRRLGHQKYIPDDTWQDWLAGRVEMDCVNAWELLPSEEVLPAFNEIFEVNPTVVATSEG